MDRWVAIVAGVMVALCVGMALFAYISYITQDADQAAASSLLTQVA